MVLVKRGEGKILNVVKDDEHNLDDEGTKKAIEAAKKEAAKKESSSTKDGANNLSVEN